MPQDPERSQIQWKKFNRHQHWNEGYIRISGKDLKILWNSSMSNNNHAWKT